MAQSGAPFVFFLSKNPVLRWTGLWSLSSLFIDNEQRTTTNDRSSIPTQNTGPESSTQVSLESSLDRAKSNRSETTDRFRSKGLPYTPPQPVNNKQQHAIFSHCDRQGRLGEASKDVRRQRKRRIGCRQKNIIIIIIINNNINNNSSEKYH